MKPTAQTPDSSNCKQYYPSPLWHYKNSKSGDYCKKRRGWFLYSLGPDNTTSEVPIELVLLHTVAL